MASTRAAERLSEAHRRSQLKLGAETVLLVLSAWPLLMAGDNIDAAFPSWLQVIMSIVAAQHRTSSTLAANYVRTFRSLELGVDAGSFSPVLADPVSHGALATSMLVTGPAVLRSALARGVPFERAEETAKATSAGAAMRHVLNGGRETVLGTVDSDRRALGWARTTSGSPCGFCAMLVSRGPVYRSDDSGGFEAHDHCACGVEPVYRSDAGWTAQARHYRDVWEEATAGLSGDEAAAAFRRHLAAQS